MSFTALFTFMVKGVYVCDPFDLGRVISSMCNKSKVEGAISFTTKFT